KRCGRAGPKRGGGKPRRSLSVRRRPTIYASLLPCPPPWPGDAMRWRIVPLLMVFVALAHFNRISITVAGTERLIGPDRISPTRMGLVYSAFLVVYTALMVPGGWFIDRFGPRTAWVVVGFGSAAGTLL